MFVIRNYEILRSKRKIRNYEILRITKNPLRYEILRSKRKNWRNVTLRMETLIVTLYDSTAFVRKFFFRFVFCMILIKLYYLYFFLEISRIKSRISKVFRNLVSILENFRLSRLVTTLLRSLQQTRKKKKN